MRKRTPPQPAKSFEDSFIAAAPAEFHDGIKAYFSARKLGIRGILPAITKNGQTLALPR